MEHADAEMIIKRFVRAVMDHRRDLRIGLRRAGEVTPEQIEAYRTLFDNVLPEAERVIRRVVFDYNDAIPSVSRITPEVVQAATRNFRDVLDLAPLGKTALATFRPLWPMTLAQLEAQITEQMHAPRSNPAPLFQKDKVAKRENLNFGSATAVYNAKNAEPAFAAFIAAEPRHADWTTLDGIAWDLAMPEGFPPYPRRGGVYSKHEAAAIYQWMRDFWPVTREIFARARLRDAEITRAGISSDRVSRVFQGIDSITRWVKDYVYGARDFPDAEGKSPKELLAATLAWGERLIRYAHALEGITPAMFQRQADPDEHMRQIEDNAIMRGATRGAAEEIYGLKPYGGPWLGALTGTPYGRRPADYIEAYPEKAKNRVAFHLSTLLDAQAKDDAAFAARQRAEADAAIRDTAIVKQKLRAVLDAGRAFTRANVQAALPGYTRGVRDRDRPVRV